MRASGPSLGLLGLQGSRIGFLEVRAQNATKKLPGDSIHDLLITQVGGHLAFDFGSRELTNPERSQGIPWRTFFIVKPLFLGKFHPTKPPRKFPQTVV